MSESTEVVVSADNGISDAIAQLKNGETALYSSIKGDDFATRMSVLKAVMGSAPIADNLGKTFKLANIIVQPTTMADESTGELVVQPRVIIITDKGEAFHAISGVLFRDISNVLALVGEPDTWPAPINVQIAREGSGNRKFFTLKLV